VAFERSGDAGSDVQFLRERFADAVEEALATGDVAQAERHLARAERALEHFDLPVAHAVYAFRRAEVELYKGRPDQAAEYYDMAAADAPSEGRRTVALQGAAMARLQAGLLGEAEQGFHSLVERSARFGDAEAEARGHVGLARVAQAKGSRAEALTQLEAASSAAARIGARTEVDAEIATEEGMMRAQLGDHEGAGAAYDRLENLLVARDVELSADVRNRAKAALDANRAVLRARTGEAQLETEPSPRPSLAGAPLAPQEELADLVAAGSLALANGDLDAAKRTLFAARRRLREQHHPALLFEASVGLAATHVLQLQLEPAHRIWAEGLEALEHLRGAAGDEASRISFLRDKQAVYSVMVRLCLALDELAQRHRGRRQALEYTEQAKSRALVETLGLTAAIAPPAQVSAELRAEEQEARRRALDLDRRARAPGPERLAAQRAYAEAHAALDKVLDRIADVAPEYVAVRRGTAARVEELRELLADGAA